MNELLSRIQDYISEQDVRNVLEAIAILLGGFLLSRIVKRRLRIGVLDAQHTLVIRRLISALLLVVAVAWALSELGLNIGVVLGAAGVLTVAIGFAAQTSVSNLISGVFLMAERPFSINDIIEVAGTKGVVMSIDSMSIKLRTFDNLMVRIPNETMLKANVTNMTYFPIRRYDMQIGVSYNEDIARVREVLFEVAHHNPLCLEEPAPLLIFLAYGESALELQFSVWAAKENWLELRTSMHEQVKRAFDAHGIVIPYPQRTVHMAAPSLSGPGPRAPAPGPEDKPEENPEQRRERER